MHASTSPASPALLTPRQAAERLAISARKLWQLTNCGEIPAVRIGRLVRYRPETLAEFAEANENGGNR